MHDGSIILYIYGIIIGTRIDYINAVEGRSLNCMHGARIGCGAQTRRSDTVIYAEGNQNPDSNGSNQCLYKCTHFGDWVDCLGPQTIVGRSKRLEVYL